MCIRDRALLNQKILHHTEHEAVADRLPATITAARWLAIRPNLMTVAEAADWVAVFDGPLAPPPVDDADRPVLTAAAAAAPAIDWGADPWHCLLYTSDAADERSSVDLGGRRIIKKKRDSEHQRQR